MSVQKINMSCTLTYLDSLHQCYIQKDKQNWRIPSEKASAVQKRSLLQDFGMANSGIIIWDPFSKYTILILEMMQLAWVSMIIDSDLPPRHAFDAAVVRSSGA